MKIVFLPLSEMDFEKVLDAYQNVKLPPVILRKVDKRYKVILGHKQLSHLPPHSRPACIVLPIGKSECKSYLRTHMDNPDTSRIALGCVIATLLGEYGFFPRTLGKFLKTRPSTIKSLSHLGSIHEDLYVMWYNKEITAQKAAHLGKFS
jgi:hypothetical protein